MRSIWPCSVSRAIPSRSEERRVGKEWWATGCGWWGTLGPSRGTLGPGHKPRYGLFCPAVTRVGSQLTLATRMEDWSSHGQHKRKSEFPIVIRSSRGEAKDSALLSSRDAGLLEPPERPQGCSRDTAGPNRPHLGLCPGPNVPLLG